VDFPHVTTVSLANYTRFLFHALTSDDLRRRRLIGVLQGAGTGLGSRLVGLVVNFLSVPLTITYLGPERYGAWVVLGSLLAWLQVADLGLGNGFANTVSTAAAQDRPDLVKIHVSNALFLLSVIAVAVGLAAVVMWPFINWSELFGVSNPATQTEISHAIAVALAIFIAQLPLGITNRIYLAYQEGRIANFWAMAGNVLGLVALFIVTRTEGGLVWLVVALSGMSLLVNLVNTLFVFTRHKRFLAPTPAHIHFRLMRDLGHVGSKFFLIQILALITFQTDNLVISAYLGAGKVPEYSLTYNLFNYTIFPQSILFTYLWTAYTEAIARDDINWVRRTFHLVLTIGVGFTVLAACIIALIAKPFIAWWATPEVVPSSTLIAWMAAWSVVNAFTNPIACLLAAASHLRAQVIYSAVATASNIALTLYLVQRWGVAGVIAATVIAYTLMICVPALVDVKLLIKRLQHAV
jgi:O-antigen/teichoic acid export membrane protein